MSVEPYLTPEQEKLLIKHRPFVLAQLRRQRSLANVGDQLEDMKQEGMIALMHSIKRWDPSRGVPLVGYASKLVRGRILRTIYKNMNHYSDGSGPTVFNLSAADDAEGEPFYLEVPDDFDWDEVDTRIVNEMTDWRDVMDRVMPYVTNTWQVKILEYLLTTDLNYKEICEAIGMQRTNFFYYMKKLRRDMPKEVLLA